MVLRKRNSKNSRQLGGLRMDSNKIVDIFGNVIEHKKPVLVLPDDGKLNVVCDWDNTISWLAEAICNMRKLDIKKWTRYNIRETGYTREEQDLIIKDFNSYSVFKKASIMDGAEKLQELVSDRNNLRFLLHTLSYCDGVAEAKKEVANEKLDFLRPEEIWLEVGADKTIVRNADIVIDDSPRAIEVSDAKIMRLLIMHEYNRQWYEEVGKKFGVIPCLDIADAVHKILLHLGWV